MKLIIFFLFVLINISNAQWEQVSTIGNYELRGVKFFNEYTGIVVGQNGIWRSTNSGINWTQVLSGSDMNSLSFFDFNNGYVVGDSGKIFRTYNNGINWVQQGNSITTNNLNGVIHSTLTRCSIGGIGGIILRTLDGGLSWSTQGIGGAIINSIVMNVNGEGLTFGGSNSEVIRSTINGGTNWLTILNLAGNICFDGTFLNNSSNFIAIGSNGSIRKTVNGGSNWTFPLSNTSSNLNAIKITSSLEGYIACDNGIILKTTNSGDNWTTVTTGISNNLNDLSFINTQTGWAVGSNGIVIRTGILLNITISNAVIPKTYCLYPNFPNPFNPSTNLRFDISNIGYVKLGVYDINGKRVDELINDILQPGEYEIRYEGKSLSSGIYFCKLEYEQYIQVIRICIIK